MEGSAKGQASRANLQRSLCAKGADPVVQVQQDVCVNQQSSQQRVHLLSEFPTEQTLCRGSTQAGRCEADEPVVWTKANAVEWKSLMICMHAKIARKETGLLPETLGDKWEAVQFLFVVHKILSKSGVWAMWMCREHAQQWEGHRPNENLLEKSSNQCRNLSGSFEQFSLAQFLTKCN